MDTFFDRKQLFVGALLLGIVEISVVVARVLIH
jgi:hypothetical protein